MRFRRRPPRDEFTRRTAEDRSISEETWEQIIERRLNACEINLQNIWEHLNARSAGDR